MRRKRGGKQSQRFWLDAVISARDFVIAVGVVVLVGGGALSRYSKAFPGIQVSRCAP